MSTFDELKAVAEATGKVVIVGVRGHNGSWFVHCDGVEFDTTPRTAARDIAQGLRRRELDVAAKAEAEAKKARAVLAALDPPTA